MTEFIGSSSDGSAGIGQTWHREGMALIADWQQRRTCWKFPLTTVKRMACRQLALTGFECHRAMAWRTGVPQSAGQLNLRMSWVRKGSGIPTLVLGRKMEDGAL